MFTILVTEDGRISEEKEGILYKTVISAIEKQLIEQMLERTKGNQLKAARILGINRNTVRAKIKKLGIDARRWKNNHETILYSK